MIASVLRRLAASIARHWLRLAVGFAAGLVSVTLGLVIALVLLEWQHVPYDDLRLATLQLWLLMIGPVIGSLLAYARRP
jgi:ethanolamine transporter EutH